MASSLFAAFSGGAIRPQTSDLSGSGVAGQWEAEVIRLAESRAAWPSAISGVEVAPSPRPSSGSAWSVSLNLDAAIGHKSADLGIHL
jgi:hypothetical protein